MRKMIIVLAATLAMVLFAASSVHADDENVSPQKLAVNVTTYEGESVLMTEGIPLWSAVPVGFSPSAAGGENHYSISTDGGKNFGGFAKMESESVMLYPDDKTSPDGRWHIRFKNTDKDGKETLSETYIVCFDLSAPSIVFENEDAIDGWTSPAEPLRFTVSDEKSGIGRIIVKSRDEVIYEEHFSDGTVPKEHGVEFEVTDTKETYNPVEVISIDQAGNSSCLTFEYRCDKTSPVISLEGISDGAHLSQAARLDIKASDDSGEASVDYVIKRNTGSEIITTEVSNEKADVSLGFDEDGKYDVLISAVDPALNRSGEIRRQFTIDRKAPEIEIGGVSTSADIRGAAYITIDVKENIREDAEVNISLTRNTLDKSESIPISSYGLVAQHDSRAVNISSDGEYYLEVSAKDGAGNTANETRRFRIDATAPKIAVGGAEDGEITAGVPVLRFAAAEMFYDSTIMTATLEKKEKSGYTQVRTQQKVMRSAEDHIDISPDEEGQYRLTCSASDRTGNISQTSLCFTVDHTPPVISGLSDMDNRFFRSFSLPVRIAEMVSDSLGVKAFAYINDSLFGEKDEIIEEGKYVLTILAEDDAGNVAQDSATFIVDHTAPQIVIKGFDRDGNLKKGSMLNVGLVDAKDRLLSVRFGDRNIAIGSDNTANIAVDDYGEYDLEVKAEDPAGNVTDTVIHASCYMYAPFLTGRIDTKEKTITDPVSDGQKDSDPLMLAIGMISVLSGTYGLTWRTYRG